MEVKEFGKLLYQLKITDQQLVNIFNSRFGISLTHYQLLMYLKNNSPSLQGVLPEVLKIDAAAVTRHLKTLENKGYVVRRKNEKNNREVFVEITADAKEKIEHCENTTDLSSVIGEQFTQDDLENLVLLLAKLGKNLK